MSTDELSSGGKETRVGDGFRLAVGTLTVFPVSAPLDVDRRVGSWAMTFAPLVGVLLAAVATAFMWLLGRPVFGWEATWYGVLGDQDLVTVHQASSTLAATLTIGLLAVLTRAIHLDGLADTADGLGSGKPAAEALAIMRKSDIGPFGVVTLVFVLLAQVVALAQHLSTSRGALAVTLALVASRLVLPVICSRGIPAARQDGLGRAVAGTVSAWQLLLAVALAVVVPAAVVGTSPAYSVVAGGTLLRGLAVLAVSLFAGAAMCWWCLRRLGGVTGDVMGACVEVTFTVALVVPAVL